MIKFYSNFGNNIQVVISRRRSVETDIHHPLPDKAVTTKMKMKETKKETKMELKETMDMKEAMITLDTMPDHTLPNHLPLPYHLPLLHHLPLPHHLSLLLSLSPPHLPLLLSPPHHLPLLSPPHHLPLLLSLCPPLTNRLVLAIPNDLRPLRPLMMLMAMVMMNTNRPYLPAKTPSRTQAKPMATHQQGLTRLVAAEGPAAEGPAKNNNLKVGLRQVNNNNQKLGRRQQTVLNEVRSRRILRQVPERRCGALREIRKNSSSSTESSNGESSGNSDDKPPDCCASSSMLEVGDSDKSSEESEKSRTSTLKDSSKLKARKSPDDSSMCICSSTNLANLRQSLVNATRSLVTESSIEIAGVSCPTTLLVPVLVLTALGLLYSWLRTMKANLSRSSPIQNKLREQPQPDPASWVVNFEVVEEREPMLGGGA